MKTNRSKPSCKELSMNLSVLPASCRRENRRICQRDAGSTWLASWLQLALLCAAVSWTALPLLAADSNPPKAMTYQGYLTDGSGVPLGNVNPANYDVVFRIFDASSAGNLKWAEKQTVTIDKGQFSVVLGEGAKNGSDPGPENIHTVFSSVDASDRFIGITVKIGVTDVDIAPRLRLVTSPYSFLATSATGVIGADGGTLLASTAPNVLTVSGQLNATGFNGSGAGLTGLTEGQIPSLDASKITSGTLADARLSANVPLMSGGKISDSVIPNPLSGKTFSSPMGITGGNTFEFGIGNSKEVNNGKIGYRTFSTGLDIVGAGTSVADRRIVFHAQGGSQFAGNVGIGTANPVFPLTLNSGDLNQARMRIENGGNYADFGRWSNYLYAQLNNSVHSAANRFASYDGDSNWDFNSDRKLKKDIVDVEPMLDRALKVQVRRYRWKEDASDATHKLGVIAQEVQPLFPEMVNEVETPDRTGEKVLTVGYGDFGVIAIKAIQELNKIVEGKDARITSLERELAALKKQVASNQEASERTEARFQALDSLVRKLAAAQPNARTVAANDSVR